jgi:hypothetical protein
MAELLPAPRIPAARNLPSYDVLAAVVGDELAQPGTIVEEAVAAAQAAVDDLERHRTGPLGTDCAEALAADAADHADGKAPETWRAAELLRTEPGRWAAAMVAARFVPTAVGRSEDRPDRKKIGATAGTVATAKGREWAKLAAEAWASRTDKVEAWLLRRTGDRLLEEFPAATCVGYRAGGQGWDDPTRLSYRPDGRKPPATGRRSSCTWSRRPAG